MPTRHQARWRPAILLAVLAGALVLAGSAASAIPVGHIMQASFPPCDWPSGPPPIESCTDTAPKVTATCVPDGISTISITRSGDGFNHLFGTFTETLTATIGPQTGPPQAEIQVLSSGIRNGSVGFPTGRILSFTSSFEFTSFDGATTISGTKTLVDDLQNIGVCREYDNEPTHSTWFGALPLTGYFYLVNAQVLEYEATLNGAPVSGPAETYLANSFATSFGGTTVNASAGHLATSFGTTHSSLGTTTWAPTPTGTNVEVTPAPGVEVTFSSVTSPGDTTVTVVAPADVPPLPADGSFLVGDPPALYEIATAATYTPPITVCVPYGGAAPPGTIPALLHYENGAWFDVASSYDEVLRVVCGQVSSLSPFAAGYRPAPVGPTSAEQCLDGGWATFTSPRFKNQGDCVAFVATKGKNAPSG